MLKRLERQGYLRRSTDGTDRRRVSVEPTPDVIGLVGELYGPVARDGAAVIERYTGEELRLIVDFLRTARTLQERHLGRVHGAI